MKRLFAILTQRCPVCMTGPIFRSVLEAHKHCPHCGVLYEREHGFYLNSMFIAYTLGFLVLLPSAFYLFWIESSVTLFSIVIIVETILLWPLIFRYSRVIWMHMDQMLDPREAEGTAENKAQFPSS
ncbi:MAG TPA: DUF983 domain-containing protein [Caldilineaceae bacterium]|nr:DUF983 domain-containing protein [Caldilineaceae bacterium]